MDRRLDFGLRVLTVALTAAAGVAAFRADYGPNSNAISDVSTVMEAGAARVKAWFLTPSEAELEELRKGRKKGS